MVDTTLKKQATVVQTFGIQTTAQVVLPVLFRATVLLLIFSLTIVIVVYALRESGIFPAISLILAPIMSLLMGIAIGIVSSLRFMQREREKQAVILKMRDQESVLFGKVRSNLERLKAEKPST